MEDAHAAVLDLQAKCNGREPTDPDQRLAFFGVYDGHGGDKVALFAGEHLHKIVAKQDSFIRGDIEQALKDGFLATDRAILEGSWASLRRLHCKLSRDPLFPPDQVIILIQTRNMKRRCPDVRLQRPSSRSIRSGWYVTGEIERSVRNARMIDCATGECR